MTQLHLALLEFESSRRKLETAETYLDVSRGISDLVQREEQSNSSGQLQVIKERLNALVAELRRDLAYAQIQNAFARIFKSMGLDPYPAEAKRPRVWLKRLRSANYSGSRGISQRLYCLLMIKTPG